MNGQGLYGLGCIVLVGKFFNFYNGAKPFDESDLFLPARKQRACKSRSPNIISIKRGAWPFNTFARIGPSDKPAFRRLLPSNCLRAAALTPICFSSQFQTHCGVSLVLVESWHFSRQCQLYQPKNPFTREKGGKMGNWLESPLKNRRLPDSALCVDDGTPAAAAATPNSNLLPSRRSSRRTSYLLPVSPFSIVPLFMVPPSLPALVWLMVNARCLRLACTFLGNNRREGGLKK